MTKKICNEFVDIASDISPALADAIDRIGPIRLQKRNNQPLVGVLVAFDVPGVAIISLTLGSLTPGCGVKLRCGKKREVKNRQRLCSATGGLTRDSLACRSC